MATNDVHYNTQEQGAENGSHHVMVQSRRFKKADTEESTDRADDGFGSWYGSDQFYMKSTQQMAATQGIQLDELTRTTELLAMVDFDFSALPEPKPPVAPVPGPGDDPLFDAWLRQGT